MRSLSAYVAPAAATAIFADANGIGMYSIGIDGGRTVLNAEAAALLGVPRDVSLDALRLAFPLLCHAEDRFRVAAALQRTIGEGGSFLQEFRIHPGGGRKETRHVVIRGQVTIRSGRRRMRGILVDVTERQRAEAQRAAALEMLRRVAQALPGIVYVHDLATGLFRHVKEEAPGTEAVAFLSEAVLMARMREDDRAPYRAHLNQCRELADAESSLVTFRIGSGEGGTRWFTSHDTVLARDAAGRPAELLCVTLDVTQKCEAVEAIRHLTATVLRSQDTERRKIARDLHDTTAQNLLAASLALEEAKAGADTTANLDLALSLIAASQNEIRTLSYLLHPPLLDEVGLDAALSWYADGFRKRTSIAVRVTDSRPPQGMAGRDRVASTEAETILFRVVQEALTNVSRHAEASVVHISLHSTTTADGQPALSVVVADDGKGFAGGRNSSGVGLLSMRERMRLAGGSLSILSAPGGGTTIQATCPAAKPNASTSRRAPDGRHLRVKMESPHASAAGLP